MPRRQASVQLRVRYGETDRMGTVYNARVLEWFECARTELLRQGGSPYVEMERRGVLLPIIEAHVEFIGRATYDDELTVTASAEMTGKARVRFDLTIRRTDGRAEVARGYTVHAVTDASGRPVRAPEWFTAALTS